MRKSIIIYTLLLSAFCSWGQVFIGTDPTNNPVLLEVKSDCRGVLIPRINIPDTMSASPVINPKEGLFVMNTHPGLEGLLFWNGTSWEMLETEQEVMAGFDGIGKRSIFVGVQKTSGMTLARSTFTTVPLTAVLGTLESGDNAVLIPEDNVYEVAASFTGTPSSKDGYLILNIRNVTQNKDLSYTMVNQNASFATIATKAIYCGLLKGGDKISLRIYYGSSSTTGTEKLKSATLCVKKLQDN
jgi:hypothetical protein